MAPPSHSNNDSAATVVAPELDAASTDVDATDDDLCPEWQHPLNHSNLEYEWILMKML